MKPFTDEEYVYREEMIELLQQADQDADAVIVEGVADKEVLERCGVESRVFTCGGKEPEAFAETVGRGHERVVILTDFDAHGKELNERFRHLLREDVHILSAHRRDIGAHLTETGRHCIEDLGPLFSSRFEKFIDVKLDRLFTPFH